MRIESFLRGTLAASLLALVGLAHAAATITIVNGNTPGVGFNDATPAAPVVAIPDGAANEIGVFEMTNSGLTPVPNPSELFLQERPENATGSVVTVSMEGTRPMMVEVRHS